MPEAPSQCRRTGFDRYQYSYRSAEDLKPPRYVRCCPAAAVRSCVFTKLPAVKAMARPLLKGAATPKMTAAPARKYE